MQKTTLLLLFLFFVSLSSYAQQYSVTVNYVKTDGSHNPALIFYDDRYKLKWDDFKAPPCNDCIEAALTNAGSGFNFAFSSNETKTTLIINVFCEFDKSQSWVKPIGRNDYILKHEQDHFDISYICTMHFVKKLQEANITASNYNEVVNTLYQQSIKELKEMQDQYDRETNHSLITDKQAEWNAKIEAALAALKNN